MTPLRRALAFLTRNLLDRPVRFLARLRGWGVLPQDEHDILREECRRAYVRTTRIMQRPSRGQRRRPDMHLFNAVRSLYLLLEGSD